MVTITFTSIVNIIIILFVSTMFVNVFNLLPKLPQEATKLSHELNKADNVNRAVISGESIPTEPLQVNKSLQH